jgi:hypothetical protein
LQHKFPKQQQETMSVSNFPPLHLFETLSSTTYKEFQGNICVRASQISVDKVFFVCPFCWTSYKKNGIPTAKAKRVIHTHGNDGDMDNRVIHRVAHCDNNYKSFFIGITEQTNRE